MFALDLQHHEDDNENFFVVEYTLYDGTKEYGDTFTYGGEYSVYADRAAAFNAAEAHYLGASKALRLFTQNLRVDTPHVGFGKRRELMGER